MLHWGLYEYMRTYKIWFLLVLVQEPDNFRLELEKIRRFRCLETGTIWPWSLDFYELKNVFSSKATRRSFPEIHSPLTSHPAQIFCLKFVIKVSHSPIQASCSNRIPSLVIWHDLFPYFSFLVKISFIILNFKK